MLIKVLGEGDAFKTTLLLIIACITAAYGELCGFYSSSATCQKLQQIKKSMNETANPCEDFFGYACDNWRLHLATPNYDSTSKMLNYNMNYNLISVMDSLDQDPESLPLKILNETYTYYKSCLNAKGSNSLMRFLEIIKPGEDLEWPMLQELQAYQRGDTNFSADNWPAERFEPFALLGQLRNYGLNNLMFNLKFVKNSSEPILAEFSPYYYFIFNTLVILNLLTELGFPQGTVYSYSVTLRQTHDNWNLEQPGYLKKSAYNTNYEEIKERLPYFAKILGNVQIHRFEDDDMIRLTSLQYFEFLMKKTWTAAEKRNLCNYIMIRLLLHLSEYSVKSFSKMDCIHEVRTQLDLPVNILFYAYIYRQDELQANADIEGLFRKTRDYMVQALDKLPDGQSYELRQIKMQVNKTSLNLGNLPRNMSVLYFNKLYGDLHNLSATNYYSNKLTLLKHLSHLPLVVERNTTYYQYYGIPAGYRFYQRPFYNSITQLLILPFVNLQPPFYHHTYDPIFKWSTLAYYLAYGLYEDLPFRRMASHHFDQATIVELLYRAYVNEQKQQLQPDFTNIPWQKLFFLNLVQSFCTTDKAFERVEFTSFVKRFPFEIESFVEAFQCDRSKMKQDRTYIEW